MRRCVCPGSYDPVHAGHVDVVRRAAGLFDEVVALVLANPAKRGLFDLEERREMLVESLADVPGARVEVVQGGLLVDHCRRLGAGAVVKGVRGAADVAYERPMALMNRHLAGVETLLLPGAPELEHVSSSLVREVAALGGDVRGLVPDAVLPRLLERLGR